MSGTDFDLVVIGAGHAGLVAAAELRRVGREPVVLEAGDVAQAWRDRYRDLHLITTRRASQLPGVRYPASVGRWPGRDDVIRYLEHYAGTSGVEIRRSTPVERVEVGSSKVGIEAGGSRFTARSVVVATGRYAEPVEPPGLRQALGRLGDVIHSAQFVAPSDHRDGVCLVVGGGASGVDMARLLAGAGRPVFHHSQHPIALLPETVAGIPVPPVAGWLGRHVPPRLLDHTVPRLLRLVGSPVSRAPYSPMPSEMLQRESLPALDRGYAHLVDARRVVQLTTLDVAASGCRGLGLDGAEHRFRPHLTVLATGYRPALGFLDERYHHHVTARQDSRPDRSGLICGIGYQRALEGQFRRARAEARHLATDATGRNNPER